MLRFALFCSRDRVKLFNGSHAVSIKSDAVNGPLVGGHKLERVAHPAEFTRLKVCVGALKIDVYELTDKPVPAPFKLFTPIKAYPYALILLRGAEAVDGRD